MGLRIGGARSVALLELSHWSLQPVTRRATAVAIVALTSKPLGSALRQRVFTIFHACRQPRRVG